jgi:hypothetical protein
MLEFPGRRRLGFKSVVAGSIAAALCIFALAATPATAATAQLHAVSAGAPTSSNTSACVTSSTSAGVGTCAGAFASARQPAAGTKSVSTPATLGSPPTTGLSPSILAQAYGLQGIPIDAGPNDVQFDNSQGEEMTVAVVEAGLPISGDTLAAGNTQLESDLNGYRSAYGLPPCTTSDGCLSIVNGTSAPSSYYGWGPSYAMDLDAISAICSNCHILLVESPTDETSDYFAAANIAATTPGVDVVDMDYTTPEFQQDADGNSESYYDTNDLTHPGVAMIAPAGNGGYGTLNYPAASPDVISVGGTVLNDTTSTSTWADDALWAGTTSGCSEYELAPSWQTDAASLCPGDGNGAERVDNDISAAAAISSNGGSATSAAFPFVFDGAWNEGGDTELSADIIAAIYALAGPPEDGVNPASNLYSNAAASSFDLTDITSGATTGCPVDDALCTASTGWDAPTGWGAPETTLALTPGGSVTGHIIDEQLGVCVDNLENGKSNGNKIDIHDCGGVNETWTVQSDGTIRMYSGNYCLTVNGSGTASATALVLWSCDGAAGQKWRFTSKYGLYNPNSNKCAAVSDVSNGVQMEIEPCSNVAVLQFSQPYAVPVVTGEIHSQEDTSNCLDNYDGELEAGNSVDTYACQGGTDTQEWTVASNGSIEIGSSYCLDWDGESGDAELQSCDYDSDGSQLWIVRSDGSLWGNDVCLYASGTANNDPVEEGACSNSTSDEWTLP